MAQTIKNVICIFLNLLSLVIISSGLRLKLTHRDSPNSPLYEPNLSDFERFNKNVEISKARASRFHRFNLQNASLRFPLMHHEYLYTVDIGLGTPVTKRTLIFDTGSHLTWTQCKPCIRCFKQNQPLFDFKKSSTYRLMLTRNKLSRGFKCRSEGCFYLMQYYSGQFSRGILAMEDFTFGTSARVSTRVANMSFGCGTTNVGDFGEGVSGILGMDKVPISFARQLGDRIKHRFSYCLTKIDSNNTKESSSYLSFGDDAVIKGANARSTPFVRMIPDTHYILKLNDISIAGQKLGLSKGTFPEGCVVDSGASISLLNGNAFVKVRNFMLVYFSRFKNVRRLMGNEVPKGLICYMHVVSNTEGLFANFPNMTFHFEGADYEVPWENSFMMLGKNVFCLAMKSENVTILGAYQQRNMRIVYDLKDDKMSFAPEDCSRGAA
ncbi:hypothetical protein ABFS82_13G057200 [Erythranthe guttata]|uniref:aspartic proteinase CDR1-like n=1 Tax=Erythranthe guttata TaxID=4155 RepID=UPI00064DD400|nr:PREDICTED: aspartic proteinase CDR1-like [Erythranthe guttata]|eukprot:XP_012847280.1 PREDICTED: aspartic proteinase CDR1-like [Erythranthe guttata]